MLSTCTQFIVYHISSICYNFENLYPEQPMTISVNIEHFVLFYLYVLYVYIYIYK